jgi:hypothetical protein
MELIKAGHIGLGELGILASIWTVMEVVHGPNGLGVLRAKAAAMGATAFFFAAWLFGGMYYVIHYGDEVKPVVNAGPWPWAHGVFMETKEHLFLVLPFLSIVVAALVWQYGDRLATDKTLRFSVYSILGVVILIGLLMAVMGYFVSAGFREAISVGS